MKRMMCVLKYVVVGIGIMVMLIGAVYQESVKLQPLTEQEVNR
jgi:hypothetical protein